MLYNSLLAQKTQIYSNRFKEDIINLGSATFILPDDFRYKVIRVSSMHVARPDLLSQHLYGSDTYGDLICKINGVSNPFELNEGMMLVVPDIADIESFYISDTWNDDISVDEGTSSYTNPVPKSKNEKRAANESIVGDQRFRIDASNRVIIY